MKSYLKSTLFFFLLLVIAISSQSAFAYSSDWEDDEESFGYQCLNCLTRFAGDSFVKRVEVTFINNTLKAKQLHIEYMKYGMIKHKSKLLLPDECYSFNCFGAYEKMACIVGYPEKKIKTGQTYKLSTFEKKDGTTKDE